MRKETKSKKAVTKKAATKTLIPKDTVDDIRTFSGLTDKPIIRDSFACEKWEHCKQHPSCAECSSRVGYQKSLAITPEVMPKEDAIALPTETAQIVKYSADAPVLTSIESSIKRDIQLAAKVDKAGAMIAIKIGLALDMAKRMIGHGFYEAWMKSKFGDIFSARRGQYYLKLAQKFQQTEYYRHLALPEKSEMGNYLAVSDESSDLGNAVASFVGDLSINELMDKHGVKSKLPGGWHPADRDMEAFVRDYPELRGKPFETWADADKEKFKTWMATQQAGDMDFAKKLNAEGFWSKLTIDIMNKGLQEKSWGVIDNKMLAELHHALGSLHREIGKAIKTNEEK